MMRSGVRECYRGKWSASASARVWGFANCITTTRTTVTIASHVRNGRHRNFRATVLPGLQLGLTLAPHVPLIGPSFANQVMSCMDVILAGS